MSLLERLVQELRGENVIEGSIGLAVERERVLGCISEVSHDHFRELLVGHPERFHVGASLERSGTQLV